VVDIRSEYGNLLRIFGEVLHLVSEDEDVASRETCSRFTVAIDAIQRSVDPASIRAAFSTMEQDAQRALVAAMR
jgi:hypothetical protein